MSFRKKISQNLMILLTGNVAASIFGVIRSFYVARFLSPAEFGVLNLINLVVGYANYIDLGTNNGGLFHSARMLGRGRVEESQSIREQLWLLTVLGAGTLSLVILSVSFIPWHSLDPYRVIMRFFSAGIFLYSVLNFFTVEARVREKFQLLGVSSGFSAVLCLILIILVTQNIRYDKVIAVAGVGLAGSLFAICVLATRLRVHFAKELDWSLLGQLLRTGLPLTIIPIIFTLFQSVDRWVLASLSERDEFGYYAFGTTLGTMLAIIPSTLAVVLSTHFIKNSSIENPGADSKVVKVSFLICSVCMAFIAGVAVLTMPYLLFYFFPQYVDAEKVISTLIFANCIIFPFPVASSFILANEKRRALAVGLATAAFLEAISVWGAYYAWGIYGAALAVMICYFSLAVFLISLVLLLLNGNIDELIKWVLLLFAPFAACYGVTQMIGIGELQRDSLGDFRQFLQSLGLYLVLSVLSFVVCGKFTLRKLL
jgi:O-antigen/teichoic acid export membrane protein